MQACRAQLVDSGRSVRYVEFHELDRTEDLFSILAREGITDAIAIDPSDDWLQRRMVAGAKRFRINLHVNADENFLCPSEQFAHFAQRKNRLFFTEFYIEQRRRHDILIEDSAPRGGKWSFDVENRKKIPKGTPIPELTFPKQDGFATEAKHYVDSHFPRLGALPPIFSTLGLASCPINGWRLSLTSVFNPSANTKTPCNKRKTFFSTRY